MSDSPAIFVNVFEVESDHVDELVALLREGLEEVVSRREGFIAAEVLVDASSNRVINVARWRSVADATATQKDPAAASFAARAAALVSSARPGIFGIGYSTR